MEAWNIRGWASDGNQVKSSISLPSKLTVMGRFGGDMFRRQFFAESSMKFGTFRQNFVPISAKYEGCFDERIK